VPFFGIFATFRSFFRCLPGKSSADALGSTVVFFDLNKKKTFAFSNLSITGSKFIIGNTMLWKTLQRLRHS